MPTYQYQCKYCGHELEELQSMSEAPLTLCPKCNTESLARVMGTGVGLIFKGSGFYLTDYKNNTGSVVKRESGKTKERGERKESGETKERGERKESGETKERGERKESGETKERAERKESGETKERAERKESGETKESGEKKESKGPSEKTEGS